MSARIKTILCALDQNLERWLLLVFYLLVVVTIGLEVVRRFVLAYSSIWGEEIARYAFIYLVWVGASLAIRDRAHIRIDFMLHYLSPRGKGIAYLCGDLLMLCLAVVAFYYSFETLLTSIKFSPVTHGLRIEQAWFLAAVPLGLSLIILRLVQSIRRDINDLLQGRAVFQGARLFD